MRTIAKSIAGGALALLLALSVAPANALDPLTPEDGVTSVDDQTSSGDVEDTGGSDNAGETELPAETEESDESSDGATAPSGEVSRPAQENAPTESELTEVPAELSVSGKLLYLPNEPSPQQLRAMSEPGEQSQPTDDEAEHAEGGTWVLATSEGPIVPVDVASLGGAVDSNAAFVGTLPVDAETQAEAQEEIKDSGSVAVVEVLDSLAESADQTGAPVVAAGRAEAPEVFAGAPAKKQHTADIVVVNGAISQTNAQSLVARAGTYWNGQTNGAVSGVTISGYRTLSTSTNLCNANSLWTQAAAKFGRTPESYYSGARHLIVYVNSGMCAQAGLGHIGSIHAGGTVWADAGTVGRGRPVSDLLAVVAHEVGHNLSLGHGQLRQCSSAKVDAPTTMQTDSQTLTRVLKPVSPCRDTEYGDAWNIMGVNPEGVTPALSIAQKDALGVLPSGSLRTVNSSGGRSQTITINAAGMNSGLRGLKVNTQNGGSFYVEFRNGGGQDAGSGLTTTNGMYYAYPTNSRFVAGVQVLKSYPKGQALWTDGVWRPFDYKRATVIPFRVGSTYYSSGKSGQSTIPVSSNARVTVISTSGSQAKVRIDYTPFIDVNYDHKFAKEIGWMSSSGLSTGNNAGNGLKVYAPKANVSREAMAAFLYRMNAPKNYKAPAKSPFVDVQKGQKFYKEIAWMYTSGLSTGTKRNGQRFYDPKAAVSREAMAAFMYRMQKPKNYKAPATSPFADVQKGQKFYKEISWMYKSGLSTGTRQKSGKPLYNPKSSVSREAMGAFLYRLKH